MTEEELIAWRDTPHMPKDVPDELLLGMADILDRIPRGWGKWISLDAGWYPLIVDLNSKLAALDPDYEIHQVKEKFGTLRFYFGLSYVADPECCTAWDAANPRPRTSWASEDPQKSVYMEAWDVWSASADLHNDSEEHRAAMTEREPAREARHAVYKQMQDITDWYEHLSAVTCEVCGNDHAETCVKGGWWKTVCQTCATERGFEGPVQT